MFEQREASGVFFDRGIRLILLDKIAKQLVSYWRVPPPATLNISLRREILMRNRKPKRHRPLLAISIEHLVEIKRILVAGEKLIEKLKELIDMFT